MKFKSESMTQVSGSIGGTTYGHNKGGMYRRARSIPTNPNSSAQQAVRATMAQLSQAWSQTLTNQQREDWGSWAQNNPISNVFGDPLILSGQQMYIRCNSIIVRAGVTRVDAAPTAQGLVQLGTVTATPEDDAANLGIGFDVNDAWVDEDGGGLLVTSGRQVSPARMFFKGPFRLAGAVLGNATTPPTSETDIANGFGETYQSPNKVFTKVVAFRADGRISETRILSGAV